ncbi:MAG: ATP-binding protein, partial [Cyanobium sp. MAG06]|nr:ATP-binding protein [Cyanobium sp. MAG06]
IKDNLFKGKIIILYGPRQVGKTTLVNKIYEEYQEKKIFIQGDTDSAMSALNKAEPVLLRSYFNNSKLIIIDEAQNIENIGRIIKVYVDKYKDSQIILTGSSSFDLSNKVREPLTGRAIEYIMYPISFAEIITSKGMMDFKSIENQLFRYGMYPGILELGEMEKINNLRFLQNNTFYKDIFALENIKKPKVLQDIIRFLAFNIGNIITSNNLSREVGSSIKTVDRYIDLLEKMFVIKRLYGYSNNKSNEIKKGYKIYFTDIGFRNSVIDNFNNIDNRNDLGQIFENVFIMERIKYCEYNNNYSNKYF